MFSKTRKDKEREAATQARRILALDLNACQYALGLMGRGLPFEDALESAEKLQKEIEKENMEELDGDREL